jgi:membrane-bound serine protease (ClpP class)
MLMDADIPEYQVSWAVIGITSQSVPRFSSFLVGYMWRAQVRKVQSGAEQLIGSEAVVLDWAGGEGHVWVEGERWNPRSDRAFAKDDSC